MQRLGRSLALPVLRRNRSAAVWDLVDLPRRAGTKFASKPDRCWSRRAPAGLHFNPAAARSPRRDYWAACGATATHEFAHGFYESIFDANVLQHCPSGTSPVGIATAA